MRFVKHEQNMQSNYLTNILINGCIQSNEQNKTNQTLSARNSEAVIAADPPIKFCNFAVSRYPYIYHFPTS